MPKTLNKITNNSTHVTLDGRLFVCGCMWLGVAASDFIEDNQFCFIVLAFLAYFRTVSLLEK
jgi:hypothetical protein